MSKSMWIETDGGILPVCEGPDNPTGKVQFWVEGVNRPYWGHYNAVRDLWFTTDSGANYPFYEPARVKYFAYIDNPYK